MISSNFFEPRRRTSLGTRTDGRRDDTVDTDADGTPDFCDSCPNSATGDTDGDGVCDDVDICPNGDDAVDIIAVYGDEGIALLQRFGDETGNAIALIREFGTPAVNLMKTLDPNAARKLLNNLDNDVIEYAMTQGPDAVAALSHWPDDFLKKYVNGHPTALIKDSNISILPFSLSPGIFQLLQPVHFIPY